MLIYDYNRTLHKYKEVHDETGGRLGELEFRYYDCFCGHKDYSIVSTTTRHHNHFDIVQCSRCGTLRINPYMTDNATQIYYKEIYGPVKRKSMTAEALFERQSKSSDDVYTVLSPFIKKDADIIDYGSGAGGRMVRFKSEGYQNVYLFDYDKKYMEYGVSKGFKAHREGNRYDLVILSHVVEHLNNPIEFIQNIAQTHLKSGGMIYIEVPMFDRHVKLIGDFHLAHKFYFTQASLTILAKLAGFKKLQDCEDAIIITPADPTVVVNESDFVQARKDSNNLLKKAIKRSKVISAKLAVRNIFTFKK